jgi:hypothetical protein
MCRRIGWSHFIPDPVNVFHVAYSLLLWRNARQNACRLLADGGFSSPQGDSANILIIVD